MKYWITTDTHFGHDAMIDYCDRPQDFERRILEGLSVVDDNDILIHLGDFCIGDDVFWHEIFMNNVKGKKWLVRGNHDRKSTTWYFRHGWDTVVKSIGMHIYGKRIILSHKPSYSLSSDLNIHGHMHNSNHRKYKTLERLLSYPLKHELLSIENTNYQPVLLQTLVEKYNNGA